MAKSPHGHPLCALAVLLSVVLASPVAGSQDSKSYARMGQAVWSAFECAALASHIGDSKEQERLFSYGMSQGRQFIDAIQRRLIKEEDVDNAVPVGVLFVLQGPTPDFILGRIFEAALDDALEGIFGDGKTMNSDEQQKFLATTKYASKNCSLVGVGGK